MLPIVTTLAQHPHTDSPRRRFWWQRLIEVGPQPRYPYVWALLTVAVATAISFALYPFEDLANLIMVYLLATVIAAIRLGRGPSITTTIVGTAAFVYFFVPNRYSFVLADLTYLQTFTIMIVVGIIVSTLTSQLRSELLATEARERSSQALYELSRDLAAAERRPEIARIVGEHLGGAVRTRGLLLEAVHGQAIQVAAPTPPNWSLSLGDTAAAQQAIDRRTMQRTGSMLFLPLTVAGAVVGVIGCEITEAGSLTSPSDRQLLESFANNVAVALHRVVVGEQVQSAHQRAEEERLRNVMLSSVSHDLRTPLASITGAITTLIDSGAVLDAETRLDLMQAIREDADALERHVRNLLDLTRLESGGLQARRDWCSLEEVVGCALGRVDTLVAGRSIDIAVPAEPLVAIDGLLVEQLLVNLLENAARYTPKGSPLHIDAAVAGERLQLRVADRGPGIPPSEREHVFTKFYRGEGHRHATGAGLGLAICRAIAQLHGGDIRVDDRDGGGAIFTVSLPTGGMQPTPPRDDEPIHEAEP